MGTHTEKKSVAFDGQVDVADVVSYLESLQSALNKGAIYVQHGARVVALEPSGKVTLEVEAKSRADKQALKISLSWERSDEAAEAVTDVFRISATEPELVTVEEVVG